MSSPSPAPDVLASIDPTEEGLLSAIAAEPDAIGPRLVYADWLQARSDPRGELIIVQHALRAQPADEQLRAREGELVERAASELLHPQLPPRALGRWVLGFVDELALTGRDLTKVRRAKLPWLGRPALRLVRHLDLTLRRPGGLRTLANAPLASSVRRLRLGTTTLPFEPITLGAVARLFPAATGLSIRGTALPAPEALDALAPLRLAHFGFEGPILGAVGVATLAHLPPDLASLEVRTPRVAADALAALRPILTGELLPGLRRLALVGHFPVGEILEALAESGRARSLDELELDISLLRDEVDTRLERHREALAKLRIVPVLGRGPIADASAHQRLGSLLQHHLERATEAVPLYEEAVRLNPRNTLAHHGRAIALHNTKRLDEALAAYDALLATAKPTASMWFNRHFTSAGLRRHEEAVVDLERAVALDPRHQDAWNALGTQRRVTGDAAGARIAYERALEFAPEHRNAPCNLGGLLVELGQPEAALAVLEPLARARPDDVWARVLIGYAALQLVRIPDTLAAADAAAGTYAVHAHLLRAAARLAEVEAAAEPERGAALAVAHAALAALLRATDCPGWIGHAWLLEARVSPGLWARAVPAGVVEPAAISEAVAAHARAVLAADARPLHAATPIDHAEAAEHAIAGALLEGDLPLAARRARALHAFVTAERPAISRTWPYGSAAAHRALEPRLDPAGRALLHALPRALRGRLPLDALLAI